MRQMPIMARRKNRQLKYNRRAAAQVQASTCEARHCAFVHCGCCCSFLHCASPAYCCVLLSSLDSQLRSSSPTGGFRGPLNPESRIASFFSQEMVLYWARFFLEEEEEEVRSPLPITLYFPSASVSRSCFADLTARERNRCRAGERERHLRIYIAPEVLDKFVSVFSGSCSSLSGRRKFDEQLRNRKWEDNLFGALDSSVRLRWERGESRRKDKGRACVCFCGYGSQAEKEVCRPTTSSGVAGCSSSWWRRSISSTTVWTASVPCCARK